MKILHSISHSRLQLETRRLRLTIKFLGFVVQRRCNLSRPVLQSHLELAGRPDHQPLLHLSGAAAGTWANLERFTYKANEKRFIIIS